MDRSLATLLRSLQTSRNTEDAARLLPSATGLLSRLSNPLNLTLLASQLLTSHHLYPKPVDLASCRSIFSVFYTAALRVVENKGKKDLYDISRSDLSNTAWTKAVIQGADERSPRWRHLLLIGGLLLGFEGQGHPELPSDLRSKLEVALVTAANLALHEKDLQDPNSQLCIAFVLNHTFPLISDEHRSQLRYDLLLPELLEATFFSREGLEHGYWLGTIDTDVKQIAGTKFNWSSKSPSAVRIQQIRSRGLVSSLGPLSRLIAHSIDNVSDPRLISGVATRLSEFGRNLSLSWRQNKLSEAEKTEEKDFLDGETIRVTLPVLLQVLRDTLFAIVICLRAIIGKLLISQILSSQQYAPTLAIQSLHLLRDTYFISHRLGQNSSSQYVFVYYTAIDILNQYPGQTEGFLAAIKPNQPGRMPAHPLERLHDLFFLNVAEHFTLALSPEANEDLLVNSAMPYVTTAGDTRLKEIYEAAHSVLLAVFAAPQNGQIAARHVPFYIETLLQSFPHHLSPRQFRLAAKSITQISAPHTALSQAMPMLQQVLLDILRDRIPNASELILPPSDPALENPPPFSEKSTLLLTITDSLSFLPLLDLEDWLVITADLLHKVNDPVQRDFCQRRFWEVLSNHDMDVERAATCAAWWTSRGGRELVLYGEFPDDQDFSMSGAIPLDSKI